jgi:hypothetical protein
MISCAHAIVGVSKGGLNQTTFFPAIYLEPPRVLSPKLWFRLQPAQETLRPEHVMAPQLSMIVDLQSLGDATRSMTAIFLPFLIPHAIPDLQDPSTHSFLPNQWLRLIPAFQSSGVSTLKSLFSHMTIFRSGISIDTCLPKSTIRISSTSPSLQDFQFSNSRFFYTSIFWS